MSEQVSLKKKSDNSAEEEDAQEKSQNKILDTNVLQQAVLKKLEVLKERLRREDPN
jgi:hypothetical protein